MPLGSSLWTRQSFFFLFFEYARHRKPDASKGKKEGGGEEAKTTPDKNTGALFMKMQTKRPKTKTRQNICGKENALPSASSYLNREEPEDLRTDAGDNMIADGEGAMSVRLPEVHELLAKLFTDLPNTVRIGSSRFQKGFDLDGNGRACGGIRRAFTDAREFETRRLRIFAHVEGHFCLSGEKTALAHPLLIPRHIRRPPPPPRPPPAHVRL